MPPDRAVFAQMYRGEPLTPTLSPRAGLRNSQIRERRIRSQIALPLRPEGGEGIFKSLIMEQTLCEYRTREEREGPAPQAREGEGQPVGGRVEPIGNCSKPGP